jgi:hypothetical protein
LKYINLPLRVGYQLSASHLDFMGIRFYSDLLTSYNTSYYWETHSYHSKLNERNPDFEKVNTMNVRIGT